MRDSDRWVTPRVVAVAIAGVVAIVLAAIAAVTYLSARGVDPAPMLKLVGAIAAGASGVLSLVVQLANRVTITNTQRQAGRLATHVGDLVDVVDTGNLPAPVSLCRDVQGGVLADASERRGAGDDQTGGFTVSGDPWAQAFLPPVPPVDATRPGRHRGGGTGQEAQPCDPPGPLQGER